VKGPTSRQTEEEEEEEVSGTCKSVFQFPSFDRFMTSEYEKQRQLNITKNKDLLNGLSLAKPEEEKIGATRSTARPLKRRKVEPALPSRTSSRLSHQTKPSYVEEDLPKVRRVSIPKTNSTPSNPKELSETEVQEIVQRWAWQATAEPPTRDENSALHFNDHPDVPSTSLILIQVRTKPYSRRDSPARCLRRIILSSHLFQNSVNNDTPRLL
jgi:hypothetical protein